MNAKGDKKSVQLLDISELEKALMDLGLYPTHHEVLKMHKTLKETNDLVDEDEFLKMVKILKLADINTTTKAKLYQMFTQACSVKEQLSRNNLANLMKQLGHPENDIELDILFNDWDIQDRGYLD